MADHQRLLKPEPFNEAFDIPDLALKTVISGRLPFAVAMAPLIERDTMAVAPKHQADDIPGMSVEAATMQKDDWWPSFDTPIEVMQTDTVNYNMVRFGQDEFG